MVEKYCFYCDKPLIKNKKFCSRKCLAKQQAIDFRKIEIRRCSWCTDEFDCVPSSTQRFCSRTCSGYNNKKQFIKYVGEEMKEIKWDEEIGHFIGVIATDGTLRKNRKQIKICQSDEELVCLLNQVINRITGREYSYKPVDTKFKGKKYRSFQIQFTSKVFYDFCLQIGIKPNKTLDLSALNVPSNFFPSVLLGVIDGDGNYNVDTKSSTAKIRIYSGSKKFLKWINNECKKYTQVKRGGLIRQVENELGKKEVLTFNTTHEVRFLVNLMYKNNNNYLSRKKNTVSFLLKSNLL